MWLIVALGVACATKAGSSGALACGVVSSVAVKLLSILLCGIIVGMSLEMFCCSLICGIMLEMLEVLVFERTFANMLRGCCFRTKFLPYLSSWYFFFCLTLYLLHSLDSRWVLFSMIWLEISLGRIDLSSLLTRAILFCSEFVYWMVSLILMLRRAFSALWMMLRASFDVI